MTIEQENDSIKPHVGITTSRAQEFGISPQRPDESFDAFRTRVSGELRHAGRIIEAHEAFTDKLYDDPNNSLALTGILGAVAQIDQGHEFSPLDGTSQIGDDIAAGQLVKTPRQERSLEELLIAMMFSRR